MMSDVPSRVLAATRRLLRPRWFWIGCAAGWGFIAYAWTETGDLYAAIAMAMEMVATAAGRLAGVVFLFWVLTPAMILVPAISGVLVGVVLLPIILLGMYGLRLWKRVVRRQT